MPVLLAEGLRRVTSDVGGATPGGTGNCLKFLNVRPVAVGRDDLGPKFD